MSDLINTDLEDKRQKKDKRRRERELSDIRFVLLSPEGRRFYWRIMAQGKIFLNPFSGEDTNTTNYNLGKQSLSRDFLNDLLEASPNSLSQLQNERKAEEEYDRLQDEQDRKQAGGLI